MKTTSRFRSFHEIFHVSKLAGLKAFLRLLAGRNGPIAWRENESRKREKEWIAPCYLRLWFSVARRACLFDISDGLMKRGGDPNASRIIARGYSRYWRIELSAELRDTHILLPSRMCYFVSSFPALPIAPAHTCVRTYMDWNVQL